MNIAASIAFFVVVAGALYVLLAAVIKRMDVRHERRSAEIRREDVG